VWTLHKKRLRRCNYRRSIKVNAVGLANGGIMIESKRKHQLRESSTVGYKTGRWFSCLRWGVKPSALNVSTTARWTWVVLNVTNSEHNWSAQSSSEMAAVFLVRTRNKIYPMRKKPWKIGVLWKMGQ